MATERHTTERHPAARETSTAITEVYVSSDGTMIDGKTYNAGDAVKVPADRAEYLSSQGIVTTEKPASEKETK